MKTKLQYLESQVPDGSIKHLVGVVKIRQMAEAILKEKGNGNISELKGRTLDAYSDLIKTANDMENAYRLLYDTYLEMGAEHAQLIAKLQHWFKPTPALSGQKDETDDYKKAFGVERS